jgi:hypothetical protein
MPDTDQTIAQAAWDKAVRIFRQWHDVTERIARDSRYGDECVSLFDRAEAKALRTVLEATIGDYGWRRTYVDPDVSDWDRAPYLSPVYPPIFLPDFTAQAARYLPR